MTFTPRREPSGEGDDQETLAAPSATARLVLADSADEVAWVRTCLRSLLAASCEAVVVDALLAVDILVTDAFEFGQAPRVVHLQITGHGTCLRIEVDSADKSATTSQWHRTTGISRLMLENLTLNWGVHRGNERKTGLPR